MNMTQQEIFDKVIKHLESQNWQLSYEPSSSNGQPACMYRGDAGMSCAIGCLIPDDVYDAGMEHQSVRAIVETYEALPAFFRVNDNLELFCELQDLHDFSMFSQGGRDNKIADIAEGYNLQIPSYSRNDDDAGG